MRLIRSRFWEASLGPNIMQVRRHAQGSSGEPVPQGLAKTLQCGPKSDYKTRCRRSETDATNYTLKRSRRPWRKSTRSQARLEVRHEPTEEQNTQQNQVVLQIIWRVKRNRNENRESWWDIKLLRSDLQRRTRLLNVSQERLCGSTQAALGISELPRNWASVGRRCIGLPTALGNDGRDLHGGLCAPCVRLPSSTGPSEPQKGMRHPSSASSGKGPVLYHKHERRSARIPAPTNPWEDPSLTQVRHANP